MTPIRFSRYRHYASPTDRARVATLEGSGRARAWGHDFFKRKPFGAVRALLFSHGYIVQGGNIQRTRWDTRKSYDWVPFRVTRAGVEHTRWVRSMPGRKMEVSDGSEVSLAQKLSYSIALLKHRQVQP